jgi:hypothetical protein
MDIELNWDLIIKLNSLIEFGVRVAGIRIIDL